MNNDTWNSCYLNGSSIILTKIILTRIESTWEWMVRMCVENPYDNRSRDGRRVAKVSGSILPIGDTRPWGRGNHRDDARYRIHIYPTAFFMDMVAFWVHLTLRERRTNRCLDCGIV